MGHSSIAVLKEFTYKIKDVKIKPQKISLPNYAPKVLKNSLKLRVIDVWDDEWTLSEMYSLQWSNYSLESYGIDFVASPKHADGIVVIGALTQNMLDPLLRTYQVIPEPKVVIALWDKALYGDPRFIGCVWKLSQYLKVDLEIPWNPPSAEDIFSFLVSFVKWNSL